MPLPRRCFPSTTRTSPRSAPGKTWRRASWSFSGARRCRRRVRMVWPGGLRRPRWGRRWGLARAKRSTPLRESTRERKATRMSAKRPHRGYCRLRARGSGIWDRASHRVMPLLCSTSRISVKSGLRRDLTLV